MRALLDTHVFLWWLLDREQLGRRARRILRDSRSVALWSVASSWELSIKVSLGKVRVPGRLRNYLPQKLQEQGITTMLVEHAHAFEVAELPQHHRDPFDRMLIAQARVERVPILTADEQFLAYDVEVVWD